MSIMDELKKLTRPYDDDDTLIDESGDLDVDVEPSFTRPAAQPQPQPAVDPMMNMGAAPAGGNMGGFVGAEIPNPLNMGGMADSSKYRVVLVKPEEFDTATTIAKHIRQGNTVILNCEETDENVARRVIDFLSGCAFALDGSIKKASKKVIIIAPREVGVEDAIEGDQLGE